MGRGRGPRQRSEGYDHDLGEVGGALGAGKGHILPYSIQREPSPADTLIFAP